MSGNQQIGEGLPNGDNARPGEAYWQEIREERLLAEGSDFPPTEAGASLRRIADGVRLSKHEAKGRRIPQIEEGQEE